MHSNLIIFRHVYVILLWKIAWYASVLVKMHYVVIFIQKWEKWVIRSEHMEVVWIDYTRTCREVCACHKHAFYFLK